MKIVYYDSISDRLKKLKEYNDTGQTLIHDDFINRLGKPTKGDSGRLTFNIVSIFCIQTFILKSVSYWHKLNRSASADTLDIEIRVIA